ncbi:MAG: hypothetical protein R3B13_07075 [Polyangiaceae bacterium]
MIGSLLALLTAFALPTDDEVAARTGAWDASVAAERRGDLEAAARILRQAWPQGAGYEVTVRLAWLAFRAGDLEGAEQLYLRARQLEGADADASKGLVATYTRRGYRELEEGDPDSARNSFRAALTVSPEDPDAKRGLEACRKQPLLAEVWGGGFYVSGAAKVSGPLLFAHLAFDVSSALRVRGAYRFQSWSSTTTTTSSTGFMGGRNQSTSKTTLARHEAYVGFGADSRWVGGEVLGLAIFETEQDAVPGEAARLRLGRRLGLTVEQAYLAFPAEAGLQLAPALYVWPSQRIVLTGGARYTHDALGSVWAGEGGVSVLTSPFELYATGHYGRARYPVTVVVPSILGVDGDVRYGGTLTTLFNLSAAFALGLNFEAHRIEQPARVTHLGAALGLRLRPFTD